MNVSESPLPGVVVIEPAVHDDERGWLSEVWHDERYAAAGLTARFVQDNVSFSLRGVVRGLHYQHPHGQAKLVSVLDGEVFDIAVDIRVGSPTFGRWFGCTLSSANRRQLFIPADFAHGFQATSDHALVSYKCSEYYRPEAEGTILWSDADLAIPWPEDAAILSDRDGAGVRLRDIEASRLPPAMG